MLSWLIEVCHLALAVLTFLVSLAELLYDGVSKAGEEKKKKVLADLAALRPQLLPVIEEALGKRAAKIFDWVTNEKVASILIDLLVAVFNAVGVFKR